MCVSPFVTSPLVSKQTHAEGWDATNGYFIFIDQSASYLLDELI